MESNLSKLLQIFENNKNISEILVRADKLNLPDWYLGAGCLAQTFWNNYHNYPLNAHIKDYDLVYFDPDISREKEQMMQEKANELFADLHIKLDVVNQARVHIWYKEEFGYPISPYTSIAAAIKTWPTTATCIGVRKTPRGNFEIEAPYGLDDLLNMIVRPNKTQITQEIYAKKVERWTKIWPKLTIVPWQNEI